MRKRQIAAGALAFLMGFSAVGICAEAETKVYDNGEMYEGTLVDGKKQGFGIQYFPETGWWKGFWNDDKVQGMVTWVSEQEEFSQIGFQNEGIWEGTLVQLTPDGGREIFSMRNGETNGLYVNVDKDGKVQEYGISEDGTGKEIVSWNEEGAVFCAEKLDDADGGKVIIVYDDGDVYIGDSINGKREGVGSYSCSDGRLFSGNWKEDVREGTGCFYYVPSGDTEEAYPLFSRGTWKAGEMDGFGIIYYSDGSRRLGVWEEGQASGYMSQV